MNKKFLILFLLFLSSCASEHIDYPLKRVKLSNFGDKEIDFKYKKIKDVEYTFCASEDILNNTSGNSSYNLSDRAVEKFLLENELKPNQYLINFSYSRKVRFYLIAISYCTKVSMYLLEKVDE